MNQNKLLLRLFSVLFSLAFFAHHSESADHLCNNLEKFLTVILKHSRCWMASLKSSPPRTLSTHPMEETGGGGTLRMSAISGAVVPQLSALYMQETRFSLHFSLCAQKALTPESPILPKLLILKIRLQELSSPILHNKRGRQVAIVPPNGQP